MHILKPIKLKNLVIDQPVCVAPMAGVTNMAFRRICNEYLPNGLIVSEMISARALLENNQKTLEMIRFHKSEKIRSLQLSGVNPNIFAAAVKKIRLENLADHIDINFGCPVPKITRQGAGSALLYKYDLFKDIIKSALQESGDIPITIKIRMGIDDDNITYLDNAKIAEDLGVSAITLHARTLRQFYAPSALWQAIKELKESIDMPVFGNGDLFTLKDICDMLRISNADGISIGRGVLGRPWFLRDALQYIQSQTSPQIAPNDPPLGIVIQIFLKHLIYLSNYYQNEQRACLDIRKHIKWYFGGYSIGALARQNLIQMTSIHDFKSFLETLPYDLSKNSLEVSKKRSGHLQNPHLPHNWLNSHYLSKDDKALIAKADLNDLLISGG